MNEIVVDGVLRDLRHLRSFAVTVPNKGKDGADLIVRVSLGLHTVSRGCERGAHHFEDENGKQRQFCEDRYAFSLGLPELSKRMGVQNYFCWAPIDRNREINYEVIVVASGSVR